MDPLPALGTFHVGPRDHDVTAVSALELKLGAFAHAGEMAQ